VHSHISTHLHTNIKPTPTKPTCYYIQPYKSFKHQQNYATLQTLRPDKPTQSYTLPRTIAPLFILRHCENTVRCDCVCRFQRFFWSLLQKGKAHKPSGNYTSGRLHNYHKVSGIILDYFRASFCQHHRVQLHPHPFSRQSNASESISHFKGLQVHLNLVRAHCQTILALHFHVVFCKVQIHLQL